MLHLFLLIFGTVIPTSFDILIKYQSFTTDVSLYSVANKMFLCGHVKPHMYIDKEMAFNILVLYLSRIESYGDYVSQRHCVQE